MPVNVSAIEGTRTIVNRTKEVRARFLGVGLRTDDSRSSLLQLRRWVLSVNEFVYQPRQKKIIILAV